MTIHVVSPGESVYSIAQQYNVPMERIISDNGLTDPGRLAVGQSLVVRFPTACHVVKPGDTLYAIAAMHGLTVDQLYQRNPELGGKSTLYPGQSLVIEQEQPKLGRMTVNGYAYPWIDRDVLRKTLPYLSYLSVFSYGFDPDTGALKGLQDEEIVRLARSYGVAPLLVLATLDEEGRFSSALSSRLLANERAQNALIENLARTMNEKGYAGLSLDFEYVTPENRDAYNDFVRRAAERLESLGFTVMVAIPPKTASNQPGLLYEAQDYAALGRSADEVVLMTYDWGYSHSQPMAVAPLDQVEAVVAYATQEIAPQKLLLGMANYGYDWTLPVTAGQPARTVSSVGAVQQAVNRNAEILYDWKAQSPYYQYWVNNVEHEVWFEDARSVQAKLALANDKNLRGISVWSLMQYFPQLWLVLSSLYTIEKRL